jgi:hypothetical protein
MFHRGVVCFVRSGPRKQPRVVYANGVHFEPLL